MSCIKTGARIYLDNYGYVARGDVYHVGDVYIFRWNPHSREYKILDHHFESNPIAVDYRVHMIENSEHWWHREDLGMTIVPIRLATQYRHG